MRHENALLHACTLFVGELIQKREDCFRITEFHCFIHYSTLVYTQMVYKSRRQEQLSQAKHSMEVRVRTSEEPDRTIPPHVVV
jgi:hypothetical protein